jgi:hypothetical protein
MVCAWFFAAAPARLDAQQARTASQILTAAQKIHDGIKDYTTDVTVVANIPGLKAPNMKAKVYFKQPDKVHIESRGFTMLPKDMFTFNLRMFDEEKFDLVLQGEEVINGNKCVKLKMLAKSDTLRIQRVMLFIDAARNLVLRMDIDPKAGSTMTCSLNYAFINNRYFLPDHIYFSMSVPQMGMHRGSNKDSQPAGQGSVDVRLENYVVNKGIPDSKFKD